MKTKEETLRALDRYADTVRRICLLHLKNEQDSEDIFQNVFLKYLLYDGVFESETHEKAWLIRVTVNACRDLLRSFYRKNTVPMDRIAEGEFAVGEEQSAVLEAVLSLPKKYKDVVYLFYYEGYTAVEIAAILQKNENTVYSLLARARRILHGELGGAAI